MFEQTQKKDPQNQIFLPCPIKNNRENGGTL